MFVEEKNMFMHIHRTIQIFLHTYTGHLSTKITSGCLCAFIFYFHWFRIFFNTLPWKYPLQLFSMRDVWNWRMVKVQESKEHRSCMSSEFIYFFS